MAAAAGKVAVQSTMGYGRMLPIALAMGVGFGFALEKGRVFEPAVIIDQMLFLRFQVTPPGQTPPHLLHAVSRGVAGHGLNLCVCVCVCVCVCAYR
jgi:hypothetical protein